MQRQQQVIQVPMEGHSSASQDAEHLINQKHDDYNSLCNKYRRLYYCTRLAAGLGAALLPFFVAISSTIASGLSILILVAVVFDQVFNPREKWSLYSKATDLLTMARLKASGEYAKYEEFLKVLEEVEHRSLGSLSSVNDLLERIRGVEHS